MGKTSLFSLSPDVQPPELSILKAWVLIQTLENKVQSQKTLLSSEGWTPAPTLIWHLVSMCKEPLDLQASTTRWQWSCPVLSKPIEFRNPGILEESLGWTCCPQCWDDAWAAGDVSQSAHCKTVYILKTICMFINRVVISVVE